MDTADRIFELLDKSGMEQKQFAAAIGATDKIVSKWRTSGLKSYRKYLSQIADVLGTSVEYLLDGTEKEPTDGNKNLPDWFYAMQALSPKAQDEVISFIEFKQLQEKGSTLGV